MIEEYVIYAGEHEVLVQVMGKSIIATGPLLRNFIGKRLKHLETYAKEERWVLRRITS